MRLSRRILIVAALAGGVAGGCDSKAHYQHATVHGKVTYAGKPVTFGSVLFVPVTPPEDQSMQPASGTINPDGTYELKSEDEAGAILGEHKVLVIAVQGDKPAEAPAAAAEKTDAAPTASKSAGAVQFKSAVPKKYSDPSTTTLTRKVVAGDNTIDLELTD